MKNATGDYILYVDADDWIEQNMTEQMYSLMSEDVDIVFCNSDHAEVEQEIKKVTDIEYETWGKERQLEEFMLHRKMTGMLWNKLIKRS